MTTAATGAMRVSRVLRTWASALHCAGVRGEGGEGGAEGVGSGGGSGAAPGVRVVRGGRHAERRHSSKNRRTNNGLFRP